MDAIGQNLSLERLEFFGAANPVAYLIAQMFDVLHRDKIMIGQPLPKLRDRLSLGSDCHRIY